MTDEEIFEHQRNEYSRAIEDAHNIVFLDVDGVLNTDAAKERSPMGYIGIQQSKVRMLHRIVSDHDAVIVLTTTWKRTWSRNLPELTLDQDSLYMIRTFAEEDVFACDKTSDDGIDRGRGIAAWLKAHVHKGWIVIDDEKFPDYRDYGIYAHLIQTSSAPGGGLKEKHIGKAGILFDRQESGKIPIEPKTPIYAASDKETDRDNGWVNNHFGRK